MAAISAANTTKVVTISSPGGEYVTKIFTYAPESASDTLDLTTHFDDIVAVTAVVNAGQDADLQTAHVTESAETVTVVTLNGAGTASTNWDSASITLTVIGTAYPQ
jgi:hypothetical protein